MPLRIDWLLAGIVALLFLLLLETLQRRAQPRAWADWAAVSGDLRRAMVEWLRVHTSTHLRALGLVLQFARAEHERLDGRPVKVRRAVDEADALAGRHVAFGLARLRRWHGVARTLATLRPLPPLRADALHEPTLRHLVWLQRLAAWPLSDERRFLLGLRVQGWALHILGWTFDAARRQAAREGGVTPALTRMEAGHKDLSALDRHALCLFDGLLAALEPDGDADGGAARLNAGAGAAGAAR